MAATSQPIALPTNNNNNEPNPDTSMGSYTGTNGSGSFNPASYTRRYIGSPASWRVSSFGNRMYTGSSPGQLFGQFDPNDFRTGKMSSSMESDRGSMINALNVFDRQEDLCRNYTCCGLDLPDLHALLEHFEEVHVVLVDRTHPQVPYPNLGAFVPKLSGQAGPSMPNQPSSTTPTQMLPNPSQSQSYFPQSAPRQVYQSGPVDPDDMELDSGPSSSHSTPSSGAPSPPDTPISTPLSTYPNSALAFAGSQPPSPHTQSSQFDGSSLQYENGGVMAFDPSTARARGMINKPHTHLASAFSRSSSLSRSGTREITPEVNANASTHYPFNAYAAYNDWSSAASTPAPGDGQGALQDVNGDGSCVPPALLFSGNTTPATTPATSRVSSPVPQHSRPSTTLSRPASTLLLSKPFKCPKPNCSKSYKQANGLKYHLTHGSCTSKPVREVEAARLLIASKTAASGPNSPTGSGPNSPNPNSAGLDQSGEYSLTQDELYAIEKRVKPFACTIGDCNRRYKNMNGLRYHYAHSGDHGKQGLEMLAKGVHECLINTRHGNGSRPTTPPNPASSSIFEGQQQQQISREVPIQHTSHFQNATQIVPIQAASSEEPQLAATFQTGYTTQPSQYHQVPYQMYQQQSYTLAGAMGTNGLNAYGAHSSPINENLDINMGG